MLSRNGGSIKVGETLTNTGAVIGSTNPDAKLEIDAKKIVTNDLKDKDYSENKGISISGIKTSMKVP